MLFYSLVGPKGSEFKINELEMEVFLRNVGKEYITTLKFNPDFKRIKKSRSKQTPIVAENQFSIESVKYVLTSIQGHVKWKSTKGAMLKLKLFTGDNEFSNAEIELAKISRDEISEDFVIHKFELPRELHLKEDVFRPRTREDG